MNIEFSGNWAVNHVTFGINFDATVDGVKVVCIVETEALQDIDPSNTMNEPTEQFKANQYLFEEIAEALILEGKVKNGQLFISSSDVRA